MRNFDEQRAARLRELHAGRVRTPEISRARLSSVYGGKPSPRPRVPAGTPCPTTAVGGLTFAADAERS